MAIPFELVPKWDADKHGDGKWYSISVVLSDGLIYYYSGMLSSVKPRFGKRIEKAQRMSYGEAYGRARNLTRFGFAPTIFHSECGVIRSKWNAFDKRVG